VGSNKAAAGGLALARTRQIEAFSLKPSTFASLEAYDTAILERFQHAGVQVIILSGYTRRISSVLLNAYPGRILNIHPSLLPKFGGQGMFGQHVHAAVLAARETESGCSVHGVTEGIDEGPVLAQARVAVLPGDTPETLAARVLEQEHRLYPVAIQQFLETLPKYGNFKMDRGFNTTPTDCRKV